MTGSGADVAFATPTEGNQIGGTFALTFDSKTTEPIAYDEAFQLTSEDKLVALQNTHATTEEEAAKHLVLEQQLVMNLNLARTEIDGLQSQLQRELDAERAHSKANASLFHAPVILCRNILPVPRSSDEPLSS